MIRKSVVSLAILVSLLFIGATTYQILDSKDAILMKLIMEGLGRNHYQEHKIDDNFSEQVFDLYIKRLDFSKRFLTEGDLERMKSYRHKLDDEIQGSSLEYFDLSVEILEARIKQAETYYKDILSRPFDFSVVEDISLENEDLPFAADKEALKERWRKSLKYQTLSRLIDLEEEQEKAETDGKLEGEKKSREALEVEAREKVLKSNDSWFKRLYQADRTDRRATYFNAIANIYDPHTGYFPPKDKEDFDISISGRLEGIGATLTESDGYIKVDRVVPGSAASRQGQLEAGDLILKVAQGADEPVDVVDMRLDHAVKLIRGKKGSEVRLSVKKIDGSQLVIPIIRDIVILEETFARSIILQKEADKKQIGYIHLPKFYTDFTKTGGRTCSEDVKKEIEKLKREGVDGLILDLRNNGGGSLYDVVDMTGLFIPTGPIVQIKGRYGAPYVMEDKDPELQYDGPLVVLVNSFSASASEIMAAAIQDYGRGVIVGSSSTFGKGTVQRFVDLDKFVDPNSSAVKPLGSMKYTTQKFYRINGGATQLKGVIPDIILPDNYAYIEIGEKEREYSMEWDEIEPVEYTSWTSLKGKLDKARKNSEKRTSDDPTFLKIEENAERMKRQRDLKFYPLEYNAFKAQDDASREEADRYKNIQQPIPEMGIRNLQSDLSYIQSDSVRMKSNDEFLERLQKDHIVFEAINILDDIR
jgi:carboxyl-terminal processing protease